MTPPRTRIELLAPQASAVPAMSKWVGIVSRSAGYAARTRTVTARAPRIPTHRSALVNGPAVVVRVGRGEIGVSVLMMTSTLALTGQRDDPTEVEMCAASGGNG